MTKTYHGSCHCGAVRFEADVDLAAGTIKCNCTFCTKVRMWEVHLKPEAFRLVAGADALATYRFGERFEHPFCRHCGVRGFGFGYVEELGGDVVYLHLATLDDLPPAALAEAPIHYANGRENLWWEPAPEFRHL